MTNEEYQQLKIKWEIANLKQMLLVINDNKETSIFHAQKSLYIRIEEGFSKKVINFILKISLKRKLKRLKKKLKK